MKFESKYDLGERLVLGGCPCVIVSVAFGVNSEEKYELQWANPFTHIKACMSRTELDNSIAINDFIRKINKAESENGDSLNSYDEACKGWITSLSDSLNSQCNDDNKEIKYNVR